MSDKVIQPTQFHAYSQEKRGPERPVRGDRGEQNESHVGYVLGADGKWVPRTNG